MKNRTRHIGVRALVKRLVLGGVVISAALGGLTLYVESERIDDIFVELAQEEAAHFARSVPEISAPFEPGNGDAIERALADLVLRDVRMAPGDFILAELYDTEHHQLAQAAEPGIERIEREIDKTPHNFPQTGDTRYRKFLIEGTPYLQIITPLVDANGRAAGFLEGIFRIAPATIQSVQAATIRITVIVVLAVLAATLLLTPLILRLNRTILRHGGELLEANLGMLRVLGGAVAKRDSDTNHHNCRVTLLAIRLGEKVGLDGSTMRRLIKGAFLHDVGKIAIADHILLKPGRLTAEEFDVMKTHVTHGIDILAQTEWLEDAADVVAGHHEKFGGGGYPAGRTGTDIPLVARIFAIADVFDALTSVRPYKPALSLADTLDILEKGRGNHFDPELLDAFIASAGDLHAAYCGREEPTLAVELKRACEIYFPAEILA